MPQAARQLKSLYCITGITVNFSGEVLLNKTCSVARKVLGNPLACSPMPPSFSHRCSPCLPLSHTDCSPCHIFLTQTAAHALPRTNCFLCPLLHNRMLLTHPLSYRLLLMPPSPSQTALLLFLTPSPHHSPPPQLLLVPHPLSIQSCDLKTM